MLLLGAGIQSAQPVPMEGQLKGRDLLPMLLLALGFKDPLPLNMEVPFNYHG